VQSQLTHSHQHLTAPPSFAVHTASVLSGFTTPLESPRAQARYLTIIFKLWSVVKNVFTKSWLSFPAEKILASLLRKQFDISSEDVKNLWSRLCAELVSTGIPTLLHVLHTRCLNRCQEEKEVIRCFCALWRETVRSWLMMTKTWMQYRMTRWIWYTFWSCLSGVFILGTCSAGAESIQILGYECIGVGIMMQQS